MFEDKFPDPFKRNLFGPASLRIKRFVDRFCHKWTNRGKNESHRPDLWEKNRTEDNAKDYKDRIDEDVKPKRRPILCIHIRKEYIGRVETGRPIEVSGKNRLVHSAEDLFANGNAFGSVVGALEFASWWFFPGRDQIECLIHPLLGMRLRGLLAFIGPAKTPESDGLALVAQLDFGFGPKLWDNHRNPTTFPYAIG
jgi:hypothetical protein